MPAILGSCSTCGAALTAQGECLPCMVRVAFDAQPADGAGATRFGDYEIARREDGSLCELGRGAMGVTYRANDTILNRHVALKVIETPSAENGHVVRDRFLREARAAAALHHPNVAGVFQFGTTPAGDRCYYAMELVEGETLESLVRRDGPLTVAAALDVATQVAAALVAAAAHGLVHRDLKPGNIMLSRTDGSGGCEVKVIDFGLAKAVAGGANEMDLTHGAFVGTPAFASPEQFSGAPADARSDIYSLGVTLWYALAGEVPYPGRSIDEIRRSHSELPLPCDQLAARKVPKPVIQLLRRILATNPAERPPSARALMELLEECRRRLGQTGSHSHGLRRPIVKVAALVALLAVVAAALFVFRDSNRTPAAPALPPEKSIAVLPFENHSGEQENAYFADGVQDEILTTLAKVADLKVISRTSVMQLRDARARNLREISQQLAVAHVVEGSVQRANNRVRVTARLVDARTDAQLWAESYERDLADVFAIQTEIAQQITRELQVTLSAPEKSAIERQPTSDLAAFDLYTRAKTLRLTTPFSPTAMKSLLEAAELLNQALARDPAFLLAWYELATVHNLIHFGGADSTAARLALAEDAVQAALRLRPDSGEAHLARAQHLYWGYRDYDGARAELEIARRTLPNDPQIYAIIAYMDRRQGRWSESARNLERALELDPRNPFTLRQIGLSYRNLRRHADRAAILDRIIAIDPTDIRARVARASHPMHTEGNTAPFRAALDSIVAENPAAERILVDDFLFLALCERDFTAAERALAAFGADRVQSHSGWHSRAMAEGMVARTRGDASAASLAFTKARAEQEELLRAQPDYAPALAVLGLIEAALGRKEEALRAGRRAVELLPLERDSMDGADMIEHLAITAAWAGEKDLAFEQLAIVARIPSSLSYGQLKLSPYWDPLRGDPRFAEIVGSLAPQPGT